MDVYKTATVYDHSEFEYPISVISECHQSVLQYLTM